MVRCQLLIVRRLLLVAVGLQLLTACPLLEDTDGGWTDTSFDSSVADVPSGGDDDGGPGPDRVDAGAVADRQSPDIRGQVDAVHDVVVEDAGVECVHEGDCAPPPPVCTSDVMLEIHTVQGCVAGRCEFQTWATRCAHYCSNGGCDGTGVVDAGGTGDADVGSCAELAAATPTQQVQIVEADLGCLGSFVQGLKSDPFSYLDAFYTLVSSAAASNQLWSLVYEEVRNDRFRFGADVVEELLANFPAAVAACVGLSRCDEWQGHILTQLHTGGMFLCPALGGLGAAELTALVPYGDYYCTEGIASTLAPLADDAAVTSLLGVLGSHTNGWSRRNAVRVLGRFAERGTGVAGGSLVLGSRAGDVRSALLAGLEADRDEDTLADIIWLLDSYYYPYLQTLPALKAHSLDPAFSSSLRFRAAGAVARLLYQRSGALPQEDVDYILAALTTDDSWVRAEAAFICETLRSEQLGGGVQAQLVSALQAAWAVESVLPARVYIARALDRFNGNTALYDQLLVDYEAEHLGQELDSAGLTIRSGLPSAELPDLMELLEEERAAFFDHLGAPFDQPVPGDPNATLTLVIFATMDEYDDYMGSFIGYGAGAGGLFLERSGRLYTFERTPQQSSFTLAQLLQHEFGHALQARFVYPGVWGDSGYHAQPKAWADEGFAEFLGVQARRRDQILFWCGLTRLPNGRASACDPAARRSAR